MRYFDSLRVIPWEPVFHWVQTIDEVADAINKPHEDYPNRVVATKSQIGLFHSVTNQNLLEIHRNVFPDLKSAGEYRNNNVTIGMHHPPKWEDLDKMMYQLEMFYKEREMSLETLIDWYADFETIHPFEDGNGRAGGIIVASISHMLHPELGYLAPNQ